MAERGNVSRKPGPDRKLGSKLAVGSFVTEEPAPQRPQAASHPPTVPEQPHFRTWHVAPADGYFRNLETQPARPNQHFQIEQIAGFAAEAKEELAGFTAKHFEAALRIKH